VAAHKEDCHDVIRTSKGTQGPGRTRRTRQRRATPPRPKQNRKSDGLHGAAKCRCSIAYTEAKETETAEQIQELPEGWEHYTRIANRRAHIRNTEVPPRNSTRQPNAAGCYEQQGRTELSHKQNTRGPENATAGIKPTRHRVARRRIPG